MKSGFHRFHRLNPDSDTSKLSDRHRVLNPSPSVSSPVDKYCTVNVLEETDGTPIWMILGEYNNETIYKGM